MLQTFLGNWESPNVFVKEDGERITVYLFRRDLDELKKLFPFDCFIQLKGNEVKNYMLLES